MSEVEVGAEVHAAVQPRVPGRRPTVVVKPSQGWASLNLREVWQYRDLLGILAGRDVKLRYKQTALGVVWVVLQPLVTALIFAVIFGRFAKLPSNGTPYFLFVFCGLLPWSLFSGALTRAGNSLIGDARLISKVYFPRLLIPLASTGAVLVDFCVGLGVMAVLMALYHVTPTWHILLLPAFLLLTLIGATGVSLCLSALNVQYRDFMYAMPFLIQVWMFASPVAYAGKLIPQKYLLIYSLNPAAGYIEGFRWCLLGRSTLTPLMVAVTIVLSVAVLIGGAFIFRRVERRFADVV
jgi:lipopolysaccharide transport system permease protein